MPVQSVSRHHLMDLKSNVNMASIAIWNWNNKPGQGDNMNNGFQFINSTFHVPVFNDADGNKIKDNISRRISVWPTGGWRLWTSLPSRRKSNQAIQLDRMSTSLIHSPNAMFEATFLKGLQRNGKLWLQYLGTKTMNWQNPYCNLIQRG